MKLSTGFIMLIFVLFTTSLFAQTGNGSRNAGVIVNVSGGLNNAGLTHDNTISSFGPFDQAAINFAGGISAIYAHSSHYHFSAGLRYAKAGAKTQELTGTDDSGNQLGKYWFVRELLFIEVPLLLVYQLNASKIVPSIFIGPNIGFLLDAEEKIESDYGANPRKSNIKAKLNTFNLSAEVGIGLKYRLNDNTALGISTCYLYGLSNQVKESAEGEQKTRDLRVFGSLYFSLR